MADEGEKRPIEGKVIGILLDRGGCEMRFWYEALSDTPSPRGANDATGDLICVSSPVLGGVGNCDAATLNPLFESVAIELLIAILAFGRNGSLVTAAILLRLDLWNVT